MKIVILGSLKNAPYDILIVPHPMSKDAGNDIGYEIAKKKFYPAIDECDEVWIYMSKAGKHTYQDLEYAISKGKIIRYLGLGYRYRDEVK